MFNQLKRYLLTVQQDKSKLSKLKWQ